MKHTNRQTAARRKERGSVLAVSAVGMLAFILAAGLTVDISHFYLVKTELQNAADAAALAGASALNSDDGGIDRANGFARESLNKYGFNETSIPGENITVLFSRNLSGPYVSAAAAKGDARNIRFVQVTLPPSAVSSTFAGSVIGSSINLNATATAGTSVPLNTFCDYIPVTAIDNDPNYFFPGNTYTIRRPPGGAVSPGNYQILAIDGSGASDDRIGLGKGVRNCVGAGSYVQTKPGVNAGAVRQGLNTRFGDYGGGLDPTEYPPDENVQEDINYQQYLDAQQARDAGRSPASGTHQSPSRGTGARNRRVVLLPLIKASEFDNGRDSVRINRFAAFFLQTKVDNGNGGDIRAEYIGVRTVLGRGGYNPGGGPVSPELSIPVIYK